MNAVAAFLRFGPSDELAAAMWAAGEAGFEPVLIGSSPLAGAGYRHVPFEAPAAGVNPLTAGDAAGRLARLLRHLRPALVHGWGGHEAVVGGVAAMMAGTGRRVLGPVAAPGGDSMAARGLARGVGALLGGIAGRGGRLLASDRAAAARLGWTTDARLVAPGTDWVRLYAELAVAP